MPKTMQTIFCFLVAEWSIILVLHNKFGWTLINFILQKLNGFESIHQSCYQKTDWRRWEIDKWYSDFWYERFHIAAYGYW